MATKVVTICDICGAEDSVKGPNKAIYSEKEGSLPILTVSGPAGALSSFHVCYDCIRKPLKLTCTAYTIGGFQLTLL